MSIGDNIGNAFEGLFVIAVIAIVCILGFVGYFIYDKTGTQTYETKKRITPDYRLEANGKKVDTVYIYKFD